ncbi:MAG: hypothetical protein Tsb009_29750 [Planctomycetaceae bacterium]
MRGFAVKVLLLVGCLVSACPQTAPCDESMPVKVELGIASHAKIGRWIPVTIRWSRQNDKPAHFIVEAPDSEGRTVRYSIHRDATSTEPPAASKNSEIVYRGLIKNGRIDGGIRIFKHVGDSKSLVQSFPGTGATTKEKSQVEHLRLKQSALLIATLGHPGGFPILTEPDDDDEESSSRSRRRSRKTLQPPNDGIYVVELDSPLQLPVTSQGYDALDVLVISGEYRLDEVRSRALQTWVRNGGHLIYCRGSNLESFLDRTRERVLPVSLGVSSTLGLSKSGGDNLEHISRWLPVPIVGQSALPDLGAIEAFAAKNTAVIFSGRVRAARLARPREISDLRGNILVEGRDGPLIFHTTYGIGQVTFCGLDFHRPPLVNWSEIHAVARRIIKETANRPIRRKATTSQQFAQSGISDLGTQLNSIQEDFPDVRKSTTWEILGWILLFVLLIGPVDYFLVHRLLKRPQWTWLTFPLWTVLAVWFALTNGHQADEDRNQIVRMNQLEILDLDATAPRKLAGRSHRQTLRVNSWASLYSSETRRYWLAMESRWKSRDGHRNIESPMLSWNGVGENIFGGMYRRGGVSFDQLQYSIAPEHSKIEGLPMDAHSTTHLKGEWLYDVPQIIEHNLTVSTTGVLRGNLQHHFEEPLTDCFLVYASRLYFLGKSKTRSQPFQWNPNTTLKIDGNEMVTADLVGWLTGIRIRVEKSVKQSGVVDEKVVTEKTRYNPKSRDVQKFLRILTFHRAAGGKQYTGLENHALGRFDLTTSLRMGRAILIGKLKTPVTRLIRNSEKSSEQSVVPPKRQTTFVRIILPVREIRKTPSFEQRPQFVQPYIPPVISAPVKAPKPKNKPPRK